MITYKIPDMVHELLLIELRDILRLREMKSLTSEYPQLTRFYNELAQITPEEATDEL